jgi:hypothetical protein
MNIASLTRTARSGCVFAMHALNSTLSIKVHKFITMLRSQRGQKRTGRRHPEMD